MIRIRIPASSANLGPGFDSFGIAWQCQNEMSFEKSDKLIITGCADKYKNKRNLAYRAFRRTLETAGIDERGVMISFDRTDIPVSRGLGSSAALICGAVTAANELYSLGFSREKLFEIATAIEGHPDNIAPALFGGLTVSAMDGNKPVTAFFEVSDKLCFTCMIPDFELSTALSRSVLPKSCSRADAVFNVSRGVLLMRALSEGDAELIKFAMQDKIHQPYRLALIKGADEARELALSCGAASMCISGAGSTLLAVGTDKAQSEKIKERFAERFPGWRVLDMRIDNTGTIIL